MRVVGFGEQLSFSYYGTHQHCKLERAPDILQTLSPPCALCCHTLCIPDQSCQSLPSLPQQPPPKALGSSNATLCPATLPDYMDVQSSCSLGSLGVSRRERAVSEYPGRRDAADISHHTHTRPLEQLVPVDFPAACSSLS
ncbi:hypothetical protein QQF64_017650 [Cirrhinus molitorella]|uniref:Uncharacterized protein n=1 Tax=Cirrhinus molitorella TaxID=172907 RepID=A0ABR3LMW5_9TELE